ncbi:MAG: thioredoxin family protein [Desulfomonile tiedjei]|nr:thioredoxin family protein [Desulfomonile tiedjei]
MLSDQDLMDVQKVASVMSDTVTILTNKPGTGDAFETNLVNIARQIAGVSMNRVEMVDEPGPSPFPEKPSLTLAVGNRRNIHYLAAPEGSELGPFLDALGWLGRGKEISGSESLTSLQDLSKPVDILVLIAAACPHCPQVVRAALALAIVQPLITVSIVDAVSFSDISERYKVKSTPTTIINDGMTIVGQIGVEQLASRLISAMGDESLTSVLDSMIKSGRAEDAAVLFCREKQPQAIVPIYLSKEFSTRMGALVTMEEALQINPRILDDIVEDLTPLLFQEEVGLRGDTAELLGKIGNPGAIPALRKAVKDPDPDVAEAAQEALEILESSLM